MLEFLSRGMMRVVIILPFVWVRGEIGAMPPGQTEALPRAIADLVRKLKDRNYDTRYEAATALEELGGAAEPAIPDLLALSRRWRKRDADCPESFRERWEVDSRKDSRPHDFPRGKNRYQSEVKRGVGSHFRGPSRPLLQHPIRAHSAAPSRRWRR